MTDFLEQANQKDREDALEHRLLLENEPDRLALALELDGGCGNLSGPHWWLELETGGLVCTSLRVFVPR